MSLQSPFISPPARFTNPPAALAQVQGICSSSVDHLRTARFSSRAL